MNKVKVQSGGMSFQVRRICHHSYREQRESPMKTAPPYSYARRRSAPRIKKNKKKRMAGPTPFGACARTPSGERAVQG